MASDPCSTGAVDVHTHVDVEFQGLQPGRGPLLKRDRFSETVARL